MAQSQQRYVTLWNSQQRICAITSLGTVYCFGNQWSSAITGPPPNAQFMQVVMGRNPSLDCYCGLTLQGQVICT